MKTGKRQPVEDAELRRRAEARLAAQAPAPGIPRLGDQARLLHELQVHQVELEMQNAELLQARDEMEKVLGRYTDLYDFAPVAYLTLDRDGEIRAVNLSGAALVGIERSRLIGRRFGQFVAGTTRQVFTDFLEKVFAGNGKVSCEVTLSAASMSLHSVQIEAVVDTSGQECRVAIIDVTERRRMEERSAFLASFPQLNPNPILEVDTFGQVTYFNPAASKMLETLGLDEDDVAVFIPSDMQDILGSWNHIDEATLYRELAVRDKFFGETIYLAPMFLVARIYTSDITERKKAEASARQALAELQDVNVELEAFNYTVSHDLRQPLTVIHSYCQILLDLCSESLDDRSKEFIREIYAGTMRMNRLIGTLLEFSSATRVTMNRQAIDLSKMAQEVAAALAEKDPERRITMRIAEGIVAEGDAGLLEVVLDNLLGNAWKYIGDREGALIEFGLQEVDGTSAFFVRDNGPGFDMAQADKLFLPFQRLPGTDVEGHGIGLATVDRIMRRHSGRVWAESEPGKGATFFFTLQPKAPA